MGLVLSKKKEMMGLVIFPWQEVERLSSSFGSREGRSGWLLTGNDNPHGAWQMCPYQVARQTRGAEKFSTKLWGKASKNSRTPPQCLNFIVSVAYVFLFGVMKHSKFCFLQIPDGFVTDQLTVKAWSTCRCSIGTFIHQLLSSLSSY